MSKIWLVVDTFAMHDSLQTFDIGKVYCIECRPQLFGRFAILGFIYNLAMKYGEMHGHE